MLHKTKDGSVVDDQGRVIYFSCKRFVRDIAKGDCCFICGAARASKPFNDEHVMPDWVVRRYGLSRQTITLSNKTTIQYSRLKIPCCKECNDLMGSEVEKQISELVTKGSDAVGRYIVEEDGLLNIFVWMGLIFVKAHLKDKSLRLHRDLRKPSRPISSLYVWEDLHHIHTVARCFYTKSKLQRSVIGSFLMVPVREESPAGKFDFVDLHFAQTMLLRLGDFAFIAVFNDSGAGPASVAAQAEAHRGPCVGDSAA
jgi:hypothetical protein